MVLTQDLLLDPSIRTWVLLPILAVMVEVGLLRHYITQLIGSKPKGTKPELLREQRILTRAQTTRANAWYLSPSSLATRKDWLAEVLSNGSYVNPKEEPKKSKNPNEPEMPANPLSNPDQMEAMMDQLKKSMVMMVPQTVIMGWINWFFSGFVLLRLPFPLTLRFKLMLQRGIDTQDMDVSWVSSISWYFLCLFGLNAVFRLILGEGNAADGTRDLAGMSSLGVGAGPAAGAPPNPFAAATGGASAGPDYAKLHAQEKENVELISTLGNRWHGSGVEERVLAMYAL
ncbi:transmembrane protein [Ceraceosorus guamensis]|uniref:ER membrane protein complex subunit 3 n=1 Tax=Ceraceosorus guamensis TaxID=1522189 RepID=A0A316VXR0_9BASI|nr:transmembrane protein [Ceraceosorus guamensis]PWN41688.1 transmembrane protein [Ceraceosorus guamensis]